MAAPAPTCTGTEPACTGVGRQSVRKPRRWVSSSPEILKRVYFRRSNEGLSVGDPQLREHAVL
eukprot:5237396-Alexandrium_andersonii.AAC.1